MTSCRLVRRVAHVSGIVGDVGEMLRHAPVGVIVSVGHGHRRAPCRVERRRRGYALVDRLALTMHALDRGHDGCLALVAVVEHDCSNQLVSGLG